MSRSYEICAAVVSDLAFDARVWKEARSLNSAGYRVKLIGCTYDLPATRRRNEQGIDVVEVTLGTRSRVSLAQRGLTLARLWIEILRTAAHAYHAHNIHVAPPAWAAARLRRARLVYDAHELYGESAGEGLFARLVGVVARHTERFIVRRSDAVITTNASRAERLRERYGTDRVLVLANVPARVDDVVPLDPGYPKGGTHRLVSGGDLRPVACLPRGDRRRLPARRAPRDHRLPSGR